MMIMEAIAQTKCMAGETIDDSLMKTKHRTINEIIDDRKTVTMRKDEVYSSHVEVYRDKNDGVFVEGRGCVLIADLRIDINC
jgi:hypothetical protein